jgi:hypothetical protein
MRFVLLFFMRFREATRGGAERSEAKSVTRNS